MDVLNMDVILKDVLNQVTSLNIDDEMINRLNEFFNALNHQLKGSNDSLIQIEKSDSTFYVITNLYNSYMAINHINTFLLDLRDYIMAFNDNQELLYDVIELLIEFKVIKLSHTIKLELFKALYNSGYLCYNTIDYKEFLKEFDYIKDDLKIISTIIDDDTFNNINLNLKYYLNELYLLDDVVTLKDVLL